MYRRPFFLLERSKRIVAEQVRRVIRDAEKPPRERERLDFACAQLPGGTAGLVFFPNGLGRSLLAISLPNIERIAVERDRLITSARMLETLIALRCHRIEKGRLPESLDDLVPAYLERVPREPLSGQPLRYSAAKRIVYSVGTDGVDAGGSSLEDPAKARADPLEPTRRIEP